MANGEWRMANGEWRMANGEWRMANGESCVSPLGNLQQADGEKNVKLQAKLVHIQRGILSREAGMGEQLMHGIAFGGKNRKLAKTLQ
jgi:hypothetical protein